MNLIFDLDGTLLYTLEDLRSSVNFSLKKFGFSTKTIEEICAAVGDGLKMLMHRSLPLDTSADVETLALKEMKHYYTLHCMDQTKPYDGIIELLQQLKSDGHKICVVSNKAHELVQILKEKYFAGLIDLALGESDQNAKKPSPDMVKNCMEAFGSNAIYIGDSEVDILTAENAKLPCVCVAWGYRSEKLLLANGAKKIVHSPAELYEYIILFLDKMA